MMSLQHKTWLMSSINCKGCGIHLIQHLFLLPVAWVRSSQSQCVSVNAVKLWQRRLVVWLQRTSSMTLFILSMPYGRVVFGQNGVANKLFLTFVFSNKEAGVQFLKDVGLLHIEVACNTRGCHTSWCADSKCTDSFRWRCCRRTSSSVCSISTSVWHDSWFQQSNLTLM